MKKMRITREDKPSLSTHLPKLIVTIVLSLFFLLPACGEKPSSQPNLTIAAAADLDPAFRELGELFEKQTGIKVTLSFGSTGLLAKQIEHGAPMDLFAAADVAFIDHLAEKGLIINDTKTLYARGRITLWIAAESQLKPAQLAQLTDTEIRRIAIANPDHAPYGIAAREALQTAGIWEKVQPKLVLAENVRQALQFAQTGDVDVAIIALSLSIQSKGNWQLVPQTEHKPIDQALAVIKTTKLEKEAKQFIDFIKSETGQTVMKKYGFIRPGEEIISKME